MNTNYVCVIFNLNYSKHPIDGLLTLKTIWMQLYHPELDVTADHFLTLASKPWGLEAKHNGGYLKQGVWEAQNPQKL